MFLKDPVTGKFTQIYTAKELEYWGKSLAEWLGNGKDWYFTFNAMYYFADHMLGGEVSKFDKEGPALIAAYESQHAVESRLPYGTESYWTSMRAHALQGREGARSAVHLAILTKKLNGFIAHANTPDAKWFEHKERRPSGDLQLLLNKYIEQARLGLLPKEKDVERHMLREQLLAQSQSEGLYGYIQDDETPDAKWILTNAHSKAEYDELQKVQRELAATAAREAVEERWKINAQLTKESVEISCPSITDIFRFGALSRYFGEDEKERKHQMLKHLVRSPIPRVFAKLQRIAKITDDIEDYTATGAAAGWTAARIAARYAPGLAAKVGERAIPVFGWVLLATDILNFGTALFSLGSNPIGVKRTIESAKALSPKRAMGRVKNTKRLKNWKPTAGTALEALQASEDATGYGLRLGPLMGCISEMFWAPVKYLAGETKGITVSMPWDRPGTAEYKAYKALGAAGELLPVLYYTKPELYFATVAVMAIALEAGAKQSFHPQWDEVYQEIKDMPLIEHPPDNPVTREVLSEMGYDPDEKVGYLGVDGPDMPTVSQLGEFYERDPGKDITTRLLEIKDSWTAYLWNCTLYDLDAISFNALSYPDGGVEYHHWNDLDMLALTAKMGVIPPLNTPPEAIKAYCDEIKLHIEINGKWPDKDLLHRWALHIFGVYDITCPPTHRYGGKPPISLYRLPER